MNSERRIQRVRAAVPASGEAKTDADILCQAAAAFGWGNHFAYRGAREVWEEVRRVWPAGAGITYPRLDVPGGLQWPCPDEEHPGTTLLHRDTFPGMGARTTLRRIGHRASAEQPGERYPLVLITGRELYAFNAGTMTGRSATALLSGGAVLEISPADAERLGFGDGVSVSVRSQHGAIVLPARISDRMQQGVVFTTFSDPAVPVNILTGPGRDPQTNTPEYKVTAVNIERCD